MAEDTSIRGTVVQFMKEWTKEEGTFTAQDVVDWVKKTFPLQDSRSFLVNKQISDCMHYVVQNDLAHRVEKGIYRINDQELVKYTDERYATSVPDAPEQSKPIALMSDQVLEFARNRKAAFEVSDFVFWLERSKGVLDPDRKKITACIAGLLRRAALSRIAKGLYIHSMYAQETAATPKPLSIAEIRDFLEAKIEEFNDMMAQVMERLKYTDMLEKSLDHWVQEAKSVGIRPGAMRVR